MDRFFYTYVSVNFWSYCSIGKRWFRWFLLSGICWNFYLWPNIWPVLVMISCAFKNTYFLFECKVCFLCFLSTCLSLRETCSVLPQWLWGLSIPVFKNHFFIHIFLGNILRCLWFVTLALLDTHTFSHYTFCGLYYLMLWPWILFVDACGWHILFYSFIL